MHRNKILMLQESTSGVVFSDSSDFKRMVEMVDCKKEESSNESDSGGVYFSDSDEFKKAKRMAGQLSDSDDASLFPRDVSDDTDCTPERNSCEDRFE